MSSLLPGEATGSEVNYSCVKYPLRIEFELDAVVSPGLGQKKTESLPTLRPHSLARGAGQAQKQWVHPIVTGTTKLGYLRKLTTLLSS